MFLYIHIYIYIYIHTFSKDLPTTSRGPPERWIATGLSFGQFKKEVLYEYTYIYIYIYIYIYTHIYTWNKTNGGGARGKDMSHDSL